MIYVIYMLVFVFALCGSPIQIKTTKSNNGVTKIYYLICTLFLILLSILLIPYSGDHDPYVIAINSINSINDPFNQQDHWEMEKGFIATCWFFKQIFSSTNNILTVITLIPICFYCYRFRRHNAIPLFSLAIYIAHFHWWMGVVLVRQMYAIIFIIIAMDIWLRYDGKICKKLLLYYIFCFIAYNFHNSSIIFYFVPFVLQVHLSFTWQCLIIIGTFIIGQLGVLTNWITTILPELDRGENYINYLYTANGLNAFAYIEKLMVFFFIYSQRKYFSNKIYAQKILMFYTLCLSVCGILFKMEVSSRFSSYFDFIIYLFVIPQLLSNMPAKKRQTFFVILAIYLIIYFIRFLSMLNQMANGI